MFAEQQLLKNFHQLSPQKQQNILDFSAFLLAQEQGDSEATTTGVMSDLEHQSLLKNIKQLIHEAKTDGPKISNRDHDKLLYGRQ